MCINEKWCNNCRKAVPVDHKCYILNLQEKIIQTKNKKDNFNGYIFYDYEAYQYNNKQIANLAIAQKICIKCLDCTTLCDICNLPIIKYDNDSFCEWLFSEQNKYYTCIAHNFKGYDSKCILNYLFNNLLPNDSTPTIIKKGSKILSIEFRNVKLIDSMSFLNMPLSNFTKAFDIKELKKGFFPHKFNSPYTLNEFDIFIIQSKIPNIILREKSLNIVYLMYNY